MDNKKNIKILVVDDEPVVREFLIVYLSMQSTEVKSVENGFQAVKAANEQRFDVVFLDLRMPGMDGIQTFYELKKINPDFTCVFMSGYTSLDEALAEMTKQPGVIYLRKPFEDLMEINEILDKACL